jgi:outer membrane protein assembly factor BamB
MWRTIASSVVTDGVVVVPHGRGEYLMGVKLGGKGDVTQSNVLWRKKIDTTDAASLVGHDGLVYQIVDRGKSRGQVTCLDAKTGEKIWEGKLPKSASTYYASPILVGDQLCMPREDGVVFMAKVSKKGLGEVKENKMGEPLIASPIFVDGKLVLRGAKHLWAIQ